MKVVINVPNIVDRIFYYKLHVLSVSVLVASVNHNVTNLYVFVLKNYGKLKINIGLVEWILDRKLKHDFKLVGHCRNILWLKL